jgi:hypothetical protein
MADIQTLTTQRLLDCKLANHQQPDTLGAHLTTIEFRLNTIISSLANNEAAILTNNDDISKVADAINSSTEAADSAALNKAVSALADQVTALTSKLQNQQSALNFIVGVLEKFQDNPVPEPTPAT